MSTDRRDALLRRVLTTNAIVSGLTGLIVFLFPESIANLIGAGATGVVRVVGAALAIFAAGVYLIARSEDKTLRSGARLILVLDVAWVVASIAVVASGWFNTTGNVIVLAVAAVVGGFAVGEGVGLRRLSEAVESTLSGSYSR